MLMPIMTDVVLTKRDKIEGWVVAAVLAVGLPVLIFVTA
jgi:hypothetical protein